MKKLTILFLLLLGIGISNDCFSQSGGRKREKHSRRAKRPGSHILTQYKSHGHADEFAKGSSGRRGKFAKLFRKSKPSWQNKSAGSVMSHQRENRGLFARYRTKGKSENAIYHGKQNIERAKNRVRGNESFQRKRNYKSR